MAAAATGPRRRSPIYMLFVQAVTIPADPTFGNDRWLLLTKH